MWRLAYYFVRSICFTSSICQYGISASVEAGLGILLPLKGKCIISGPRSCTIPPLARLSRLFRSSPAPAFEIFKYACATGRILTAIRAAMLHTFPRFGCDGLAASHSFNLPSLAYQFSAACSSCCSVVIELRGIGCILPVLRRLLCGQIYLKLSAGKGEIEVLKLMEIEYSDKVLV